MRRTDKPRKKTRKEIVLEYIKFMKIMGYYSELVSYMYRLSKDRNAYVNLGINGYRYFDFGGRNYYRIDTVSHNKCMIEYFVTTIRNHCRSSLTQHFVMEFLIQRPLNCYDYNKSWDLTELLWLYFKEKHIDNCIIVD